MAIINADDIGTTFLFVLPPGWILAGTVAAVTDTHVVLKDAAYIENVAKESAFSAAFAGDAKGQKEIVSAAHPVPDRHRVALAYIGQAVPMAATAKVWSRQHAAATIRGAR